MEQQQAQMPSVRTKQGEFGWVDLVAKDIEGQTRFYESLLGWTHEDVPTDGGPAYRLFYLGGAQVAGASQATPETYPPEMPSIWNTYIMADDVDATVRRATELGGSVAMPAMNVMGQGRMAAIQDPAGAPVFLWQTREHGSVQKAGVPGALMWNDLNTRDPEKAAEFFARLFGWDVEQVGQAPSPYWQIKVYGQPEGGIVPMPEQMASSVPAFWLVYFGVENVRDFVPRAVAAGGKAQMEPMDMATTTFAVLSDPVGAVFAVMEPPRG